MATFSDDFNRADSSDLGPGWVEVSGDWSIIGGQLAPDTSSGNTILRAATPMDSSDNYAQGTITTSIAASQGVWCRGNATLSSGYLWRTNGSSWDLFSVVGGSFTAIGTYPVALTPGDTAKVQAVGNTIKGYVNGIERVSVTNTAVTSGVNVGFRVMAVAGLRYDNFTAGDVTAGVTIALTPATAAEAARTLTGGKSGVLGTATGSEAAQALTGTKTAGLGPALEASAVHALTGTKAAPLTPTAIIESAQALTGATSRSLTPAAVVETARPLAGGKTAILAPALESATARPLAPAGPIIDDDVNITVGRPHGASITVGRPHGSGWKVGAPW